MLNQAQKIVAYDAVQSLNERLSQVEGQVSTLQEEFERIKGTRANLLCQLSPIWMAPPEILSYVFQLVHEEEVAIVIDSIKFYRARGGIFTFRIAISHVCKHFRNVAIRTSTLWTVIRVQSHTSSQMNYTNACLERSGTSSFAIFLDCLHSNITSAEVADVMALVQANMSRLKRFTAILSSDELMNIAMGYLDRPAPQMTVLELIQKFDSRAVGPPSGPFTFLGNEMNNLTKLRLQATPISLSQLNVKNLVEFDLVYYPDELKLDWKDFWTFIQNSPSLRRLNVENVRLSQPTEGLAVLGICTLNSLAELQLSVMRLDDCLTLVSHLDAPNLKTFILRGSLSRDYSDLLNQMIRPVVLFPSLTSLWFEFVQLNDETAVVRLRDAYPRFKSWRADRRGWSRRGFICLRAAVEEDPNVANIEIGLFGIISLM